MRTAIVALAALFLACAATMADAQPVTTGVKPPDGQPLSAATPQTTANGATFTAPAEWRIVARANSRVLIPPEGDTHVALVDVEAADAAAAVAAGWASYRPDAHRPLKLTLPQAPYNGWEERYRYEYETSPNEKAVVTAWAWR